MKKALVISVMGLACLQALAQQSGTSQSRPDATSATPSTTRSTTPSSGASSAPASGTGASSAPVAGASTLGVTVTEMQAVLLGWSVKRDLMGKTVYNDQKDRIGKIDDVILGPPSQGSSTPPATYAIIGAGGFLGIGKHDVAIPMPQLKMQGGQLTLAGATKASLKALPAFEYARK